MYIAGWTGKELVDSMVLAVHVVTEGGWTGKQLVDSMVLAVCVVTEGWMDWQTTG